MIPVGIENTIQLRGNECIAIRNPSWFSNREFTRRQFHLQHDSRFIRGGECSLGRAEAVIADMVQPVGMHRLENPPPTLKVRGRITGQRESSSIVGATEKRRSPVESELRTLHAHFPDSESHVRAIAIVSADKRHCEIAQ